MTTFNRGTRAAVSRHVEQLVGDRLVRGDVERLAGRAWDLALDTWSGAARAVRDSAEVLLGRVNRYVYVSSGSVYAPPPPVGVTEDAPTVAARVDGNADAGYPERKRGAELAVQAAFGDRALLVRAGSILGPFDNVGRLPWWLARIARGGEVLAPGPPDLPLQYIDARDLARWLIDAAAAGRAGPFNVVSSRGHATMGSLLEACVDAAGAPGARLTWLAPEFLEGHGIAPWSDLPLWIPPGHEYTGLHAADVTRALEASLHCRPVEETVHDTWNWMRSRDGDAGCRPWSAARLGTSRGSRWCLRPGTRA